MTAARRYHSTDPRQLPLMLALSGDWVSAAPANDVTPRARSVSPPKWSEPGPSRQLSLFDRPMQRPYVVGQSYGICQILRSTGGDPTSGAQRAKQTAEVDELMERVFNELWEEHGEEFATMRLFEIVSGAPTYRHPDWMLEQWVEWKAELNQEFSGSGREQALPSHDVYEADEEP